MVGVVAGEIAACKLLAQGGSQLLEGWRILYIFVADARECHYLFRYLLLRVDKLVFANLGSIRVYLNI